MRPPRLLQRLFVSRKQRRAWKRDLQEIAASPELDAAIAAKGETMKEQKKLLWRRAWHAAKQSRGDKHGRHIRRRYPKKRNG